MIVELAVLNDLHQTGAGFRKDRMVCFETIHQHGKLAFPQRQGSSCDDDTLTIAMTSIARHFQRWFHANDRNVVFVSQLVGCGGSGGAAGSGGGGGTEKPAVDMRTDFIWFKVEVPEGVEVTDVAGDTADRAQFKFTESEHASDRFIPVFDSDKNADELFDYEAKWNASFEWTENDPVKYNGKTWRNASYTHSGGVTTEYFTEAGGGSVYVRIDNVEEHKDAVETMMKSLEFADDIAEAKTEAMDVKLDDIEIKR